MGKVRIGRMRTGYAKTILEAQSPSRAVHNPFGCLGQPCDLASVSNHGSIRLSFSIGFENLRALS